MTTYVCDLKVRSYELDAFGHLNHAVYLNYFETARFQALEEAGFDLTTLGERGWGIHVVRVEVDFRSEAFLGDRIRISTRTHELRNSSMALEQTARNLSRDEARAADALVTVVWVGPDRRPMRIPPEVRKAFPPSGETSP